MSKTVQFIDNPGGCIVSNNILNRRGRLKWCLREEPINSIDNGWRFMSEIDTDEYLNDPRNLSVCDFNSVAAIEPAILAIYNCEVGADLELRLLEGKRIFVDQTTGRQIYPD